MKKKTKQLIYETAKRLFIEKGYEVGSRELAKEAGVSQSLILYYFGSKRNIGIQVLKEDYQILSTYLKYIVDPKENPLLFILTFTNMNLRLRENDPKMARFITGVMKEDLLEQSIYEGNQQEVFIPLVTAMPDNGYSFEKKFKLAIGCIFGVQRSLQWKINDGLDITYGESFDYIVRTFLFALHLIYTESEIHKLIETSNRLVDDLFTKYPKLLNTNTYLLNEITN
ncbi:TetR/AcrR family transcriptional regulator [Acetobacterium malicum]|uniref:TetR/AcrR family transcriptional regulator n=1 Tax=Acetobacterium malicum TaxID=52692 RepID=UPI00042A1068|nr:TetR/AcrR family transcriptional regulator [Acetobacterium dehalogenans]